MNLMQLFLAVPAAFLILGNSVAIAGETVGYSGRHPRRAVPPLVSQGGLRQPHRHDDRVVRLLHLRHRRALIFNEVFFPTFDNRDAGRICFVLRRLHRAALRRRRLRPLRRQDRSQADAGVRAAADGRGDAADRPATWRRLDRHLGTDFARHAALRSGLWRRGRVGWRGADGGRARSRAPAWPSGFALPRLANAKGAATLFDLLPDFAEKHDAHVSTADGPTASSH